MARTITQFNNMRPDKPEWTDANHIMFLTNVEPLYYLYEKVPVINNGPPISGLFEEKQRFPFTPTLNFQTLSLANGANSINYMISSNNVGSPFDIYTSWDDGRVFGTQVLRLPNGTIISTNHTLLGTCFAATYPICKLFTFADKIVAVTSSYDSAWPTGRDLSYTTPTGSGSSATWTTSPFNSVTNPYNFVTSPMGDTFLDKLWLSDGYLTSGFNMSNIRGFINNGAAIQQDTSLVLNLPAFYSILKIVNYRNKYLAVAGVYNSAGSNLTIPNLNGATNLPRGNYIFMFTGLTKGYQYAINLPGEFVDMLIVGSKLKVMVKRGMGRYSLYHVSGDSLIFEEDLGFVAPEMFPSPQRLPLLEYRGGLAIITAIPANTGLYIINNEDYECRYLLNFISPSPSGYVSNVIDGSLFAFSGSNLYIKKTSGTDYLPSSMKTQWVDVDTKLTSIDIWYESPPQIAGDMIGTVLSTWGEEQGRYNTSLNDIRYIGASSRYNTLTKTTLDCKGLVADKVQLSVTTAIGFGSTWRPIIRKIQINESKQ